MPWPWFIWGFAALFLVGAPTVAVQNVYSAIRSLTKADGKATPVTDGRVHNSTVNPEQSLNRQRSKLRQLHSIRSALQPGYVLPAEVECRFETVCSWTWADNEGFQVATPHDGGGPTVDADGKTNGHFLLLQATSPKERHVTSPLFRDAPAECRLEVALFQHGMQALKVVVQALNHTQWLIGDIPSDETNRWLVHKFSIGRIKQLFSILLEIVPGKSGTSWVALDNIKLIDCFPAYGSASCTPTQFRCMDSDLCINATNLCDITQDCLYGDDEVENCEKMPPGAKCNFEENLCGWYNTEKKLQWTRHNGSTPTNKTGPDFDNTFKNSTGKYLYVNMALAPPQGEGFASAAILNSVVFNPPPRVHGNVTSRFYNSCTVRFYYHQRGSHKASISLLLTELTPNENVTQEIWWSRADHGDVWLRRTIILPNVTHRYFLQFEARKGISFIGDIAIDDVSLSPECFGLNIPPEELRGYDYYNPRLSSDATLYKRTHPDFINVTYYELTTCGVKGRFGPTQENCTIAYNNTAVKVKVLTEPKLAGIQRWTASQEGYYTLILSGASGGKGSSGMGSSRGAMVQTVLELRKGQELYILVGQEGSNACIKSLGQSRNSTCESFSTSTNLTGIRGILHMKLRDGGGGGGGATFVFLRNKTKHPQPLAIAAGGGGLGLGKFVDTGIQHGQAINMSRSPVSGTMYGDDSAGSGGGWTMYKELMIDPEHLDVMGESLLAGGRGGRACYTSADGNGDGGFGGGGGGCIGGGGGGGFAGGNTKSHNQTNGEGGVSFLDPSLSLPQWSVARSAWAVGPGRVLLLPAVPGCGCDYRCLALDATRSHVTCICPRNWRLASDNKSCILNDVDNDPYSPTLIIILIIIIIILVMTFGVLCFILYNRYQHRTSGVLGRKCLTGPDLQLNRLRVASDSMMTEYNPNYEFNGAIYTLKDLKDIPRDQLRLVKALGQGAFGEVYQGFYRQRSGDPLEMAVAVKTLPEMSTGQAEMDFLMEALIMSKFNHPNIVHFIGVCFDKHPRFIVLELLAGGDLKNFLRESRPKPERCSQLTMEDLITISIHVARGCKYMEDNRFIHRDIAARNCLLTTKGPGRVVKIADFGMSRDIYRSDYYRKGGKAMLPIKWMPPEAFLDGIFTSKTDVWSFGVLLWEIMSMGYMPYTGCANRDVMQLVTSGGRLEPPANCPGPLYAIMTQCWHPTPEQRPTFSLILERLDYCLQDPQILGAPLPVFSRLPSNERDATVMRPSDRSYLTVPPPAPPQPPLLLGDYLVPSSVSDDSWETSFVHQSKSTQPLLLNNNHHQSPPPPPPPPHQQEQQQLTLDVCKLESDGAYANVTCNGPITC